MHLHHRDIQFNFGNYQISFISYNTHHHFKAFFYVFAQTRIVLNKADIVKPEELMRVQSALIWNISPLMSSAQPPVMYTVSLWSMPYEAGAPQRLLQAQERELLRDLRQAIDKRIENKIASARRFAVSNFRLKISLNINNTNFVKQVNKKLLNIFTPMEAENTLALLI